MGGSDVVLNSFRLDAFMDERNAYDEVRNVRVVTGNNLPYIQAVFSHRDRHGNEHLRLMGPLYALVTEAVRLLNCSVEFQLHESMESLQLFYGVFSPHLGLYNLAHSGGVVEELNMLSKYRIFSN